MGLAAGHSMGVLAAACRQAPTPHSGALPPSLTACAAIASLGSIACTKRRRRDGDEGQQSVGLALGWCERSDGGWLGRCAPKHKSQIAYRMRRRRRHRCHRRRRRRQPRRPAGTCMEREGPRGQWVSSVQVAAVTAARAGAACSVGSGVLPHNSTRRPINAAHAFGDVALSSAALQARWRPCCGPSTARQPTGKPESAQTPHRERSNAWAPARQHSRAATSRACRMVVGGSEGAWLLAAEEQGCSRERRMVCRRAQGGVFVGGKAPRSI